MNRIIQLVDQEGDERGLYSIDDVVKDEYIQEFYLHWEKFEDSVDTFEEHWNERHGDDVQLTRVFTEIISI